jgi:putative membrane protein (TIGR04086 family)
MEHNQETQGFSLRAALIGAGATMVTVLTLGMVLGALAYWWDLPAGRENLLLLMAVGLAYLVGGAWAAAGARHRGWLHGLVAGLLAIGPHWLLVRSMDTAAFASEWLLVTLGLSAALLGGITGVNLRRL